MSNFETANLVRSVVADRELIPVMTHFHLYEGRIQGANGKMTLDAPWPEFHRDDSINVPALPFVKAFESMKDPHLSIKDEFLHIQEGKMRVKIPISLDKYPKCERPEGWDPMDNSLLHALRKLRPFVSNDASRPWACGVLYREGFFYATNNVVLARTRWNPSSFSEVTQFSVPGFTIDQLVRCNLEVTAMHVDQHKIAFELENDTWLESVVYTEAWPEVQTMIPDTNDLPRMAVGLVAQVEKLIPFVPDNRHPVIRFLGDRIATMEGGMEAEIDVDCGNAAFHAIPLLDVLKVATSADFNRYPKPVPWRSADGEVDGIIAGVRI